MPAELRDVLLDFHWDRERLHALTLPTRTVPSAELAWHLELPFWSADGAPFQISPNEVAENPATHRQQWQRTLAADLRHPLDTYQHPSGHVVILDGIHRLLKAAVMKQEFITVRVLSAHHFDAIAVPVPR
ncbi:hypothetical protein AWB85_08910 [Mycobacteroides immunogenum]|uniref:ParB/Sulfiredoxin domain-containing protein n=2 Tax=Mycobacteroides immunogenum TaxID=83262 RepID=A0A179V7V6_9MYCO|nr:hypothetical protein AWB85_08910 [Mycobacteroides immunogenum]